MRLKVLTLCLLGLGLTGCASNGVLQNSQKAQAAAVSGLETRTANAVNAIYHTPSFEYRGQATVRFKPDLKNNAELKPQALEQALKLQIDQYLRVQRVPLNSAQKNALYQSMLNELQGGANDDESRNKIIQKVDGYLSGLSFNFDGAVDYRQKIFSYNPTIKYKKENLQIEARLPLVLDLKNHRVYANYYSFLPGVASPTRKSDFVYADFSKYKDLIDQVDLKQLMDYLEQSSALPYLVADQSQLKSLPVTEAEKKAGVVEKVRFEMPFEDFILQQQAFSIVNKEFLAKSVINFEKIKETSIAKTKTAADEVDAEDEDDLGASYYGQDLTAEEKAAYRASNKLYELIRQQIYGLEDEDEDEVGVEEVEEVEEEAGQDVASALDAVEDDGEVIDTAGENAIDAAVAVSGSASTAPALEQCEALRQHPKDAKIGDIQYCHSNYDIQIMSPIEDKESPVLPWFLQLGQAMEIFAPYQSAQLQDAQAVAALWKKHAADLAKVKPKQSAGRVINNVSIDAQGRAVYMDYQIDLNIPEVGALDFKFDMNLDHYGQAKSIDRKALTHAVSFTELHQDSRLGRTAAELLGTPIAESKKKAEPVESFNKQLEALASKIYDQTQSYSKAYQAVFALKMSVEQPKLFKHFSTQELNEIAQVYAYSYADESVFNPKGKALDDLNALVKKHHLESAEQYDHGLATSVDELVMSVVEQAKTRQEWQALVKKYKQPKAVFAQYYVSRFIEENSVEPEFKAKLQVIAERLAQTYIDARNNKLTKESVKSFSDGDENYINHDLYRESFAKTMTQFK